MPAVVCTSSPSTCEAYGSTQTAFRFDEPPQAPTRRGDSRIRAGAFRRQSRAVEIRTVAGPSSVAQCVFIGGPYTV
jgi:hypothetical protein